MDAVLRNFKNIPCPRGEQCSQPGCQWFHSRDDSSEGGNAKGKNKEDTQDDHYEPAAKKQRTSVSPPPLKRKAAASPSDQQSPRKRVATQPAKSQLATGMLLQEELAGPNDGIRTPSSLAKASPDNSKQETTASSSKPRALPNAADQVKTRPLNSPGVKGAVFSKTATPSPASAEIKKRSAVSSGSSATPFKTPTSKSARPSQTSMGQNSSTPSQTKTKPSRKPETLNPRHLDTPPASHEFRLRALKMLHDYYAALNNDLKKQPGDKHKELVMTDQELIWLALDDEQKLATQKAALYNNNIKNRVYNVKRMKLPQWIDERTAATKKPEPPKTGYQPVVLDTGLPPELELELLREHLLTPIKDLAKFGYVPEVISEEDIAKAKDAEEAAKGWEKCDRCTTRFQVFPGRREEDGALTSSNKCTYHYGKVYYLERDRTDKGAQDLKRLRCCKQAIGDSAGCVQADTHVFKTTDPKRLAGVLPFAATPPNPLVPANRVVAMDCEMGYTVRGFELIRMTVTNWPDGKELLDVLVQPVGEVLDLNSRWSGVWPEDFANAEPWTVQGTSMNSAADPGNPTAPAKKKLQIVSSPIVARDLLFSLISPSTPILGHGLENDLNAVRVVHPTVVDTVLLFPHARGLPLRHSLKALMKTHLDRDIQVETAAPTGHDSAEDAKAAGDLVRWKIKDKWARMRMDGWRLEGGYFLPPGSKKKAEGKLTVEDLEY